MGPFGDYLSGYSQKTVKAIFSQENRNKNSCQKEVSADKDLTGSGSNSRTKSNRAVRGTPDQKDHFGDKWKSCHQFLKNVYWLFCRAAKSQ